MGRVEKVGLRIKLDIIFMQNLVGTNASPRRWSISVDVAKETASEK
jgi:hypothetical protein